MLNFDYNNMEKDKKEHEGHSHEQKIFPHLVKSHSASKNALTLAKVELDKNMTSIEHLNSKPTR